MDLSSGETVVVPIDLLVDDALAVGEALPAAVTLLGNHPNPFNPTTAITFALPRGMAVNLDVYSLQGRRVRRLLQGSQGAGIHAAVWDGRDRQGRTVASGVYMARLVTEEGVLVSKMLLAK